MRLDMFPAKLQPFFSDPNVNISGAESRIFQINFVDTRVVDTLGPCMAKLSATMVSTMQDKQVLVFH